MVKTKLQVLIEEDRKIQNKDTNKENGIDKNFVNNKKSIYIKKDKVNMTVQNNIENKIEDEKY